MRRGGKGDETPPADRRSTSIRRKGSASITDSFDAMTSLSAAAADSARSREAGPGLP